jgi:hypothetical protein
MRPPLRRTAQRLALAATALLVTLLAVEGAASAVSGRLLFTPGLRAWTAGLAPARGGDDLFAPHADVPAASDGPRAGTGSSTEGVYRVHADPLVGYTLRPDSHLFVAGAPVSTDALGLRLSPGAAATPAAARAGLRIAILGDSIAFGYGLRDDETIAAQLAALLAGSRGPHEPAVSCRTVAIPGWNHANATHFLLDHLDAIAPDIVIDIPVGNDLLDTDGMDEHGLRRAAPDIAQRDPWLSAYQGSSLAWLKPLMQQMLGDPAAVAARLGPSALESDLTAESSARYDAQGASFALLSARLAERGARLAVAPYIENLPGWHLRERLLAVTPELPVLPLYSGVPPEFTLGSDPHPNAESAAVMATWIAGELLERGWVTRGANLPLSPVDAAHQARRAPQHTPDEVRSVCATLRSQALGQLRSVVDLSTGDGLAQICGGLGLDGSAGSRCALVLARPAGAAALEVELAPFPGRPELCPLEVTVQVDGATLGTLAVPGDGSPCRSRWPLPPGEGPLEIRLVPERWVTATVRGAQAIVSFRPRRIACIAP